MINHPVSIPKVQEGFSIEQIGLTGPLVTPISDLPVSTVLMPPVQTTLSASTLAKVNPFAWIITKLP